MTAFATWIKQAHRAEVIESYADIGQVAVRFKYRGVERVECVSANQGPSAEPLAVGEQGTVRYLSTPQQGLWTFSRKAPPVTPDKE